MHIKSAVLLFYIALNSGCSKAPETGPCQEIPKHFSVSLYAPPSQEQAQFFSKNFKACKKRNKKHNRNALFSVGVSVFHGLGTEKDPIKAFLWFKGAADKGHKGAQELLAEMFMNGIGVPRDPLIAKKYLAVSLLPHKED